MVDAGLSAGLSGVHVKIALRVEGGGVMPVIALRMSTVGVDGDELRWQLSRGPGMGETLRVLSPFGIECGLPLLKEHRRHAERTRRQG